MSLGCLGLILTAQPPPGGGSRRSNGSPLPRWVTWFVVLAAVFLVGIPVLLLAAIWGVWLLHGG